MIFQEIRDILVDGKIPAKRASLRWCKANLPSQVQFIIDSTPDIKDFTNKLLQFSDVEVKEDIDAVLNLINKTISI